MIRAGVVGSPIAHSLSPLIHTAWLKAAAIEGRYDSFELKHALADFFHDGFADLKGLNVTIPFKVDVLSLVDRVSERARRAGAANLVWHEHGAVVADNTDGTGLLAAFTEQAPGFRPAAGPVVILGAGGAARGAAAAFIGAGAPEVRIVNRSPAKASALCEQLGGRAVMSAEFGDAAAVINATSLGLGGGDGPAIDLDCLPATTVVMDMVYRPLETRFLADARARGHRTVDGLAMLIGQARPSFATLFEEEPPTHVDVRALCVAALERTP